MLELIAVTFLFLKTGEKFATQEMAGPTVTAFTDRLGEEVGVKFAPTVLNQPAAAVKAVELGKPPVGVVTPGFFLIYEKALAMRPVLEIERAGAGPSQFVLIARADAPAEPADWAGKRIATVLAAEERYVKGVVLGERFGAELRLLAVTDIENAVFDLAENPAGAADGVLLEAGQWELYKEDPDLGGALKVVYTSPELPRDLVVAFTANLEKFELEKLTKALRDMTETEEGRQLLRSLQIGALAEPNQDRLNAARQRFHGN